MSPRLFDPNADLTRGNICRFETEEKILSLILIEGVQSLFLFLIKFLYKTSAEYSEGRELKDVYNYYTGWAKNHFLLK